MKGRGTLCFWAPHTRLSFLFAQWSYTLTLDTWLESPGRGTRLRVNAEPVIRSLFPLVLV